MAQWNMMVLRSCSVLPMDSLARLDPLLDWSLLYVQIVRHHQLTCLRGSCVHWCSGTGINDGTGFPSTVFSLVYKSMYEAGGKIICTFVAGIYIIIDYSNCLMFTSMHSGHGTAPDNQSISNSKTLLCCPP